MPFDTDTRIAIGLLAAAHADRRSTLAVFLRATEREILGAAPTPEQLAELREFHRDANAEAVLRRRKKLGRILLPIAVLVNIAGALMIGPLLQTLVGSGFRGGRAVVYAIGGIGIAMFAIDFCCWSLLRGKDPQSPLDRMMDKG